ncbi:hypothetical protein GGI07_001392 [Coemansia sp. Benny D115]|nr:hypothetical protein GGI07_001392 [Coemansia sp. Benny D115]
MAHALPQGADDTRAHLHRGRDVPSASPTPIPIVRQRQQPAAAAAAATPDSAVLDRMLELESAIATVKSSLDNHASSYYSVASQIAELNARIGRLGVADRHMAEHHLPSISVDNDYEEPNNSSSEYSRSTADMGPLLSSLSHSMPTQIAAHMDTVKSRITPDAAAPVASDREEGDEHYTRIQEMIDSLIKDAGSALQTTPDCTQSSLLTCSGDSTDMPRSRDPLWSPEQLSSVSTVFDDPLMSSTPVDSLRRAAPKSATGTSFDLPDMPTTPTDRLLLTRRPASAMSMGSRGLRRSKPRPRTPLGKLRPRQDPAEADAESDSDMSSLGALANVHGMRTANSRHRPRSSKQQQKQSGHYSDRCAPGSHSHQQWLGRKRSDTVDSIMSNSSETCVSPVTRMSHEFYRTPSNMRASSQLLVDTLCTPTRRHFDFGIDEHEEDKLLPYMPRRQMDMQKTGINAQEKHAFPQLYTDDQLLSGKERQERQVSENNGSIHASNNVPFIRRVRNSVTRAMLRSASFVDDSVNDDIAAYSASPSRFSAENTGVSFGRSRSNTVACDVVDRPLEHAEYVAQSLQTQLQLPRFPFSKD